MTQAKDSANSKKKSKRARLGRGLGALIDQGGPAPVSLDLESKAAQNTEQYNNKSAVTSGTENQPTDAERIREIEIEQVVPNPHQPRRAFDEDALKALADSISTHGLMQPIVVRPAKSGGGYELVAGERRWRATKLAGQRTIRAILSEADDERSAELALIENIQRADLNPIERAMGFAQLINRFGLTQQQLAKRMGISRPAVANLMRLLELDTELRELIANGTLSTGHGKVLLSCDDPDRRKSLAEQCIAEGWTVRLLESNVALSDGDRLKAPKNTSNTQAHEPTTQNRVASVLHDLERRLSEELGTRVTLSTNAKGSKGRILIEFYDLDQFDGLLERLGVADEGSTL